VSYSREAPSIFGRRLRMDLLGAARPKFRSNRVLCVLCVEMFTFSRCSLCLCGELREANAWRLHARRVIAPGWSIFRLGISREIFVNDEIYAEEQERIFARAWLFVGHESQIPNPGDYFVSSMGEEAVILCRDRANAIHVFLNSCRHRGMKVFAREN
jgi:hypothetical protein